MSHARCASLFKMDEYVSQKSHSCAASFIVLLFGTYLVASIQEITPRSGLLEKWPI
jgi:hypothetical protein